MPTLARIANAPICAYHGNFVRLMSIAIHYSAVSRNPGCPLRRQLQTSAKLSASCFPLLARDLSTLLWRGRRRLLELRFDAELDQLDRRLCQCFDLTADNVDRFLEVARGLQGRHEIGQACNRHAPARDCH